MKSYIYIYIYSCIHIYIAAEDSRLRRAAETGAQAHSELSENLPQGRTQKGPRVSEYLLGIALLLIASSPVALPFVSIVVPFGGYLLGSLLYIWLNQKRNYDGDYR